LRADLPAENFIYLGDTARLPYGTKSRESVVRYSVQAADALVDRDIKCLVVACNTASAVALEALRDRFAPLPVIGVIEPGAEAACAASRSGRIAVIATEGTVQGGAYPRAIRKRVPTAEVITRACPLFVALAEEGWIDGPIVEAIARRYLEPIFAASGTSAPDVLLLGCTHFPLLAGAIRSVLPAGVNIVDSARTTAHAVLAELESRALLNLAQAAGRTLLLATDGAERFARVGGRFFGATLARGDIEIIDL
jgi:glutamate racemase